MLKTTKKRTNGQSSIICEIMWNKQWFETTLCFSYDRKSVAHAEVIVKPPWCWIELFLEFNIREKGLLRVRGEKEKKRWTSMGDKKG